MPGEGEGDNWRDELPENLRDHGWLKKYTSPAELAKAHVETVRETRRRLDPDNVVVAPREGSSDEDVSRFNKHMGIPTAADAYDFGPPVIMDPGRPDLPAVRVDENDVATMRKLAHDNGLSQKQAKAVWDQLLKDGMRRRSTSDQERQNAYAESSRKLQDTFGDKLPEKQQLISVPRSMFVLDKDGKDVPERVEAYKTLHEREFFPGGLGADPDYIAYQISVGENTGSDRFLPGERPKGPAGGQNGNPGGAPGSDRVLNDIYDPANAGKRVDLTRVGDPNAQHMKMPWEQDAPAAT